MSWPLTGGKNRALGAIAGEQLLDGLGGLPIQLALALPSGQAADLGRDVGRRVR